MKEKEAQELLTQLFNRHNVPVIPAIFHPKPLTKIEDVSEKLEDVGLGQFADSVTVKTITKWSFNENEITGKWGFEFYGRPEPKEVRQAFKHYLERLGGTYIRKSPTPRKEAEAWMKCKNTGDPCDPESYYCHRLGYTSKSIQNKLCERLIGDEEAEG